MKLSHNDKFRVLIVAGTARVDPSTVERYLEGRAVHEETRERIEYAIGAWLWPDLMRPRRNLEAA